MHCPVTELAKQLISRESVSPDAVSYTHLTLPTNA